ncbi:MAG: hypothetical protein QXL10_04110 [Candidatus Bathyarchaeia archaeon]
MSLLTSVGLQVNPRKPLFNLLKNGQVNIQPLAANSKVLNDLFMKTLDSEAQVVFKEIKLFEVDGPIIHWETTVSALT